jgi:hypothetical protein
MAAPGQREPPEERSDENQPEHEDDADGIVCDNGQRESEDADESDQCGDCRQAPLDTGAIRLPEKGRRVRPRRVLGRRHAGLLRSHSPRPNAGAGRLSAVF